MMFPAVVAIGDKNVVKNHRAEAQHHELAGVSYRKRGVESIDFQGLPAQAIIVREVRNVLTKNIAKKSQLETLVKSVCCDDDFFIVLKQQHLAAFRKYIELKERKDQSHNSDCTDHHEHNANRV